MVISATWTTTAHQIARQPCDLVTVPARQGLEAVGILRVRTDIGPVLHDRSPATLGFLVPRGTAGSWCLPGSSCTAAEDERALVVGGLSGTRWLLPPHIAAPHTDPADLRAALGEAAVTIAVVDRP